MLHCTVFRARWWEEKEISKFRREGRLSGKLLLGTTTNYVSETRV
jgi:hypothetical protein